MANFTKITNSSQHNSHIIYITYLNNHQLIKDINFGYNVITGEIFDVFPSFADTFYLNLDKDIIKPIIDDIIDEFKSHNINKIWWNVDNELAPMLQGNYSYSRNFFIEIYKTCICELFNTVKLKDSKFYLDITEYQNKE